MSNAAAVSPEYPKWMRKSGVPDKRVFSAEDEAKARDEGWSHEVIVSEQKPPLGMSAPPVAQAVQPPAGTVPTAVLDGMLEAQSERFQKQWEKKCKELDALKAEHHVLTEARTNLASEHDKMVEAHKMLNDAHTALSKEHATLLKERNEQLRTAKPQPVRPPAGSGGPPVGPGA